MSDAQAGGPSPARRRGARTRASVEGGSERTCTGLPAEGRIRAVIEAVMPSVDGGRFPIKRCQGERVAVQADCFTDGHDALMCLLRWRHESESQWHEARMQAAPNDRWLGELRVERLGR